MIKALFNLIGFIFKLLCKGLHYCLKGFIWYLSNTGMLISNFIKMQSKPKKISKKQEVL